MTILEITDIVETASRVVDQLEYIMQEIERTNLNNEEVQELETIIYNTNSVLHNEFTDIESIVGTLRVTNKAYDAKYFDIIKML